MDPATRRSGETHSATRTGTRSKSKFVTWCFTSNPCRRNEQRGQVESLCQRFRLSPDLSDCRTYIRLLLHFSGNRVSQELAVGTPADLAGACLDGEFVVAREEEAYDARVRGPNRKFRSRLGRLECHYHLRTLRAD